jgi:hypothetical protein
LRVPLISPLASSSVVVEPRWSFSCHSVVSAPGLVLASVTSATVSPPNER